LFFQLGDLALPSTVIFFEVAVGGTAVVTSAMVTHLS